MMAITRANRSAAFTLIELLIVMSVIVALTGLFAVAFPMVRTRAQVKATEADIQQFLSGCANYHQEWGAYPPSGNSALVGALREGTRRGAAHARLVPDRIQQVGVQDGVNRLTLAGDIDATQSTLSVSPATLLPFFTNPEGGAAMPKQYGAIKIDEEWITFSGVDGGTLLNCRRGMFGTRRAEHVGNSEVLMYEYVDPWGTPYAYTIAKDYGKTGTDQVLTQTGYCGTDQPCDPRFTHQPSSEQQLCFENCGQFQAVSAGLNRKFFRTDPLSGKPVDPIKEDDDIRNW